MIASKILFSKLFDDKPGKKKSQILVNTQVIPCKPTYMGIIGNA